MVEMKVCSFCGREIEPGTGSMYVKKDGTVMLFCTNKCSKNMIDMGRVPRTVTWTRAYAREKDVRMKGPETEAKLARKEAKKAAKAAKPEGKPAEASVEAVPVTAEVAPEVKVVEKPVEKPAEKPAKAKKVKAEKSAEEKPAKVKKAKAEKSAEEKKV